MIDLKRIVRIAAFTLIYLIGLIVDPIVKLSSLRENQALSNFKSNFVGFPYFTKITGRHTLFHIF